MAKNQKVAVATIDETQQALATITNIPDARKWLHISLGLVDATIKEYRAADIKGTREDRDTAYSNAVKAGELRLMLEAKLGELIKLEQKAGRLATSNRSKMGNIGVTHLKDIGLTKMDSSRAQQIFDHQDLIPVMVGKSLAKMSTDLPTRTKMERIIKGIKRAAIRDQNAELIKSVSPLPQGQFKTLLIDPPWDWGDEADVDQFGRARPDYETMSLEDIRSFSVFGETIPDKAESNAHIYLWITNRSLPKGFGLLQSWGFRYVTLLTWCKPSFGMGNYFRGQTEHLLFGVKGSCPLLRSDIGTWFLADRGSDHSVKPEKIYEIIETCSPGPWLEIFARRNRPGWASWGAEIGTGSLIRIVSKSE